MKVDWVTTDCTNVHVWQFERKSRGEINFIVMNMIQEIPQKFFLHWNSQNWWRYQILISMVFFYNAKFCFDVVVLRSEAYVCIFKKNNKFRIFDAPFHISFFLDITLATRECLCKNLQKYSPLLHISSSSFDCDYTDVEFCSFLSFGSLHILLMKRCAHSRNDHADNERRQTVRRKRRQIAY